MPTILYFRCPHCGYENNPEYRFCGMCGTSLPRPPAIQREPPRRETVSEPRAQAREGTAGENDGRQQGGGWQSEPGRSESARVAESSSSYPLASLRSPEGASPEASQSAREAIPLSRWAPEAPAGPVSGPSFLGLADEPGQSVSYLLEDDKPPVGRRRTIALLIIILAIGSFAVWHWKHTGSIYPWVAGPSGSLSPEASGAKPVSEAAPQSAQNQGAPSDTKSNAAVDTQTKPPVADAKPATAAPVPASPDQGAPPPASTPGAVTVQNDDSANGRTGQLAGAGSSATASSAANTQPSPNAVPAESPSDRTAAASAKKSAASEGGSATNKVSKASQPAPDTAAENNEDKGEPLFIQGQRYLYGTGVRQNCDLAQKSLLMAAENSNIQAQSTLATMYATGHCVPRSLPLAYRWFAKASHLEPSNSRIEQDLEILWQQMTPEEKQIAIKNR